MALGTVTRVDYWGGQPKRPVFKDRISVVGEASYTTGGATGLLAALRALTGDTRVILGAQCTSQRLAATGAVLTEKYDVTYDIVNDALQVWVSDDGTLDDELAGTTDISTILFEFEITSY